MLLACPVHIRKVHHEIPGDPKKSRTVHIIRPPNDWTFMPMESQNGFLICLLNGDEWF